MSQPVLGTVLVIDDNEAGLYVKSRLLKQAGWVTLEAGTGTDGLAIIEREGDLELVIVDVHLPDMMGFEVCRQLKKSRPEIPVLMTSATFIASQDRTYGLDEGADAYLTEPIEQPVLLSQVRALQRIRAAERRQRQSEERLQFALEASQAASWHWDMRTGKVEISNGYRSIYGLPLDYEVTYDTWLELVVPADRERVRAYGEQIFQSGCEYAIEFRIDHPERGERWLMARGRIERDAKGRPARFAGINRDITERKRADAKLRESGALLHGVANAARVGLWLIDLDHRIRFANPAWLELLGLDPESNVIGRTFEEVVGAERYQWIKASAARVLDGETVYREHSGAAPGATRAGAETRMVTLQPVRGVDGAVTGILGVAMDISQRKRIEGALLESEERLRSALKAGKLGVQEINPVTGEMRWDATVCKLFGVPEDEIISQDTFQQGVHPSDLPRVKGAMKDALDPSGTHRYEAEYRVVSRDGTVRWVVADGDVTFVGDTPVRMVGTIQEVSDRKRAEENIQLLMREVSHRSKNMLSLVQAIARQTAAGDPHEFSERFSQRIQALAAGQDLLVNSSWHGVDLEALVRTQLAHFSDLIGTRITVSGPPVPVPAAVAQTIGMALHELATNAGKYGALSNGTGTVKIAWELDRGDDRFAMTWCEHGGPQVSPPAKRGFGMTVVDAMVKMNLYGKVDLDFAPCGLVWRLTCAASRVIEEAAVVRKAAPTVQALQKLHPGRKRRILIVEDETIIAVDLAQQLEAADFAVVGPAQSVAEAFDQIERVGCDAAILDVNLGAETSEPIARALMQSATPFIIVSGYARAQQPEIFQQAVLLPKPVAMERLIRELHRCMAA